MLVSSSDVEGHTEIGEIAVREGLGLSSAKTAGDGGLHLVQSLGLGGSPLRSEQGCFPSESNHELLVELVVLREYQCLFDGTSGLVAVTGEDQGTGEPGLKVRYHLRGGVDSLE